MTKNTSEIQAVRNRCLSNAEDLLSVAERELGHGVDHVCFHLALLALEEIGKSILVTISFAVSLADVEQGSLKDPFDDHEKKIFWALWGVAFKSRDFTKETLLEAKELSKTLHERRLLYLYVDPGGLVDGRTQIKEGEVEGLMKTIRARLELEKENQIVDEFENKDIGTLKWFFEATQDEDKKRFIFGAPSLKKFEEQKNSKDWMIWLKEVFDKEDIRMHELTQKELTRQRPEGSETATPKYRMTVRIQSQSHSIRNNAFNTWNKGVKDIRIHKSDRKEAKRYTKSEMVVVFTIPKAVQVAQLWDYGFSMANILMIAFNVATSGLFWWYIPKDIETFYEEIADIEVDKAGNTKLKIAIGKKLALDWDNAKMVLGENEMRRVMTVFSFLMREHKKMEGFLKTYAFALAVFSKIDIHFRLEANAFEEFFKAFKTALLIFGDWDSKSNLKETIEKQFIGVAHFKELDQAIQVGIDLDPPLGKRPNVTLTEIAVIKMYCDAYVQLKARQYFEGLAAGNPAATKKH